LEDKDAHGSGSDCEFGSVFAPACRGLGLAVGVESRLLGRSLDRPVENCLLAGSLAQPPHRITLLARRLLGWLFVKAPPLHFTKHAFTLHFLFQDTESLFDVVVAYKNLQLIFLLSRGAAHKNDPVRPQCTSIAARSRKCTGKITRARFSADIPRRCAR